MIRFIQRLLVFGVVVGYYSPSFGLNYDRLRDKQQRDSMTRDESKPPFKSGKDVHLELGQLDFVKLNNVNQIYKNSPLTLGIGTSWDRPLGDSFSAGPVFQLVGISARGKQHQNPGDNGQNLKESSGAISLSLLHFKAGYKVSWKLSGRGSRYVLDLVGGYGEAYYEEVREGVVSGANYSKEDLGKVSATQTDSEKSIGNRGWYHGSFVRTSIKILLNQWDQGQIRSLQNTMGFNGVYMEPFIEAGFGMPGSPVLLAAGDNASKVDFSYNQIGLAFSFVHNI